MFAAFLEARESAAASAAVLPIFVPALEHFFVL
jgi:hypothetical protein